MKRVFVYGLVLLLASFLCLSSNTLKSAQDLPPDPYGIMAISNL